jgi:Tfp pilus assembly protein PilF
LALLSSIVTVAAQRAGGSLNLNELIPLHSRLLLAAKALFGYLQKMLWPEGLVPFYPYPQFTSIRSLEYSLPLLGIVVVTAACIVLSRKQKVWLAVWVCYVVMLIPVLGIVQVGHQAMADRYTYLPSLGPFLLAGLGAARLSSRIQSPSGRMAVIAGAGVLVTLLSYGTLKQIRVWNNSITLWTSVILRYPAIDTLPYHNRALGYKRLGMYNEALQDFSRAIEIDPFDADLYNKRALVYQEMGRVDMAVADYDRSISRNPSSADTYNNLGVLYAKEKAYSKAIENFDKALSLKPNDTDSLVNRGMAYGLTGLYDQALKDFDRAVALAPNLATGYNARGKLYLKMGRQDLAAEDFAQACRLGITDACNPL